MPKPFLIGIEIEEIAFGAVLRKLEGLPGVVALHMDFTKPNAPKLTKTNGMAHDEPPKKRGRPPGATPSHPDMTGEQMILEIVHAGKTVSLNDLREGFEAAGRSPASVSSCLYKLAQRGEIVRSGPNAYRIGKRPRKAKAKKG
jgi:hypothetical protein